MKQAESLHVRVTPADLVDIDQVAVSMELTRSDAIRTLFRAAKLLLKQSEAELKRIARAERAAEQNGTSFSEEYLLDLAQEIQQTEGLSLRDAWLEADRRQPLIRHAFQSQLAADLCRQGKTRRRPTRRQPMEAL